MTGRRLFILGNSFSKPIPLNPFPFLYIPQFSRFTLLVYLTLSQLEAEDRHRASSAAPTRHRLGKPGEAHPFILSSQGEDDLAVQLRRQAAGAALLCLGSALLAGWLFSRLF